MENGNSLKKIKPLSKNYKFFQNKHCEYFPCHNIEDNHDFNCLFCYCPLYSLGENCNGNFSYTVSGIKTCINCTVPHIKQKGYEHIQKNIKKIIDNTKLIASIK